MEYLEYAEEIKTLLKRVSNNFRSIMMSHISEHGFTIPQFLLIHELYHTPNITLIELSNRLGLAKSTVSGILDRLEKQEVVKRIRSEDDRRAVNISLTPKMYEIKDSLDIVRNEYLAEVFKDVEKAEIEKIVTALSTLNSLMESHKK